MYRLGFVIRRGCTHSRTDWSVKAPPMFPSCRNGRKRLLSISCSNAPQGVTLKHASGSAHPCFCYFGSDSASQDAPGKASSLTVYNPPLSFDNRMQAFELQLSTICAPARRLHYVPSYSLNNNCLSNGYLVQACCRDILENFA